jgi:glucans biosynthesis protein
MMRAALGRTVNRIRSTWKLIPERDMLRRDLLKSVLAAAAMPVAADGLRAQTVPAEQPPQPAPPSFNFDAVVEQARILAARAYEPNQGLAPDVLRNLSFDAYRDLRFRADRALLAGDGSRYRLQMFHLGFLYNRVVRINLVRDGVVMPVPYSPDLFDYGRNRFDPPLSPNLGFAGFRLHFPLNEPQVFDELVSFIGASYFRVLGRGQRYGLSARGLAIDTALPQGEEFPFFREFWIETPRENRDDVVVMALLDSPSLTGAFRFHIYPGESTVTWVQVTLVPRRPVRKLGLAPLTSMYFYGENQLRPPTDFRPEVHDSDGLLIHNGTGEWIWRPLRNPSVLAVSAFVDQNVRGFGLVQRDRDFQHYEDLELHYERRPSYWIEPDGQWGEGHVELVEIPTPDETNDNIVAYWVPRTELRPQEPIHYRYRLLSMMSVSERASGHPGGRVINTFHKRLMPHEAPEHRDPTVRRFLIDFAGGDLGYYLRSPDLVSVVPTASNGQILRSFVTPNPAISGFRAVFDFKAQASQTADLRAFLRAGQRTLTETWIYAWRTES